MEKKYLKTTENGFAFCDEQEAEFVCVEKKEFNGLENALRIVREKGIQQVNKEQADEHGYTLLRAELSEYDEELKAWKVTKSTPYSVKIPLNEVSAVIEADLREYYGFMELPYFEKEYGFGNKVSTRNQMSKKELLKLKRMVEQGMYEQTQNEDAKAKMKFIIENKIITFEIQKYSRNFGQGVYEVTYWSTEAI